MGEKASDIWQEITVFSRAGRGGADGYRVQKHELLRRAGGAEYIRLLACLVAVRLQHCARARAENEAVRSANQKGLFAEDIRPFDSTRLRKHDTASNNRP